MAVVYQHIRKDTNEVFYIGIGKTEKRAYSKWGRNLFWKRITNFTTYTVEIIHENITWEEACGLEKFYIKKYGRKDLGTGILCNKTDGGEGNINPSDEIRKLYSERQIGEKNHMYGRTGEKNHRYGIKHTEEARKKISELRQGIKLSDKHVKAIIMANTGRKKTEETRKKISEAQIGEKNHMWGKNGTAVSNSKLSSESVIWIRNNYKKGHLTFGQRPLAKKFGVSKTTIKNVIENKLWKNP